MTLQIGEALGNQTQQYNQLVSDTNTRLMAAIADFEVAKNLKFQEVDASIVTYKNQLSNEMQAHYDNLDSAVHGYHDTMQEILQGNAAIQGRLDVIDADYQILKDYKAKDGEWLQRLGDAERDLLEAFETIRSLRTRIEALEAGGGSGGGSVDLGPITGRLDTLEGDVGYLKDSDRIFVWNNDDLVTDD